MQNEVGCESRGGESEVNPMAVREIAYYKWQTTAAETILGSGGTAVLNVIQDLTLRLARLAGCTTENCGLSEVREDSGGGNVAHAVIVGSRKLIRST